MHSHGPAPSARVVNVDELRIRSVEELVDGLVKDVTINDCSIDHERILIEGSNG